MFKPDPTFIVIGDLMLDININGKITKIANEAPIPVFNKSSASVSLGGSANVLANLASLGCSKLYALGYIGVDDEGTTIKNMMIEKNINLDYLVIHSDKPTISKTRFFVNNTIVFRYDKEDPEPLTNEYEMKMINNFNMILDKNEKIDGVILSDYNKGVLTKNICNYVINKCNELHISTFVDPKIDPIKYTGCTLIKPNKSEANRLFNMNINEIGLLSAHNLINEHIHCEWSLITLAEEGISLSVDKNTHIHIEPSNKLDVIDVTGAGDTVLSIISYYWNRFNDKECLLRLTNELARISVMHKGVYIIKKEDVNHIINDQHLLYSDNNIIFTNGCFDLPHIGHLQLLKFCKSLGGKVIVGLNSDESVKQLKGDQRPINNISIRKEFLEALPWVDEVIIFNEDTPLNLIKQIKPHIIVKGGDYTPETVVGVEYVKKVIIFSYIDGHSTTNTINKISNITI
jgi:D-beta-D-heptose 7-phosphate kinase/D-beta-D-heptose 1-phosphate adenosyltransferase